MAFSTATASAALSSYHHHRNHHCHLRSRKNIPFSWRPSSSMPSRLTLLLARAKFEKFDPLEVATDGPVPPSVNASQQVAQEQELGLDEDSDLPSDLVDSIRQSSRASAMFISSGGLRAIVELLIPQVQFLDAEGAQAELWEMSRIFLESLIEEAETERVKAIFPDAGAAALLKYQWNDAKFGFSSLSDRKPVDDNDEIIVMVVPDYQMLGYVEQIASALSDEPPRPLIMWNPRLVSEDVGVGINVRKLRKYFLSSFTVVYSMRPLPSGAIFRCYPGMWKVFYDDVNRPNRYLLAKELPSRPDATDIELIFGNVAKKSANKPSLLGKVVAMFSSLNRFMKAISR